MLFTLEQFNAETITKLKVYSTSPYCLKETSARFTRTLLDLASGLDPSPDNLILPHHRASRDKTMYFYKTEMNEQPSKNSLSREEHYLGLILTGRFNGDLNPKSHGVTETLMNSIRYMSSFKINMKY